MTEPAIQPTQRQTTPPRVPPRESPADFVARTMAELQTFTGEQASERLGAIRDAVDNGTLDGGLETVRLATRSLERLVSVDVHANAPSASLTRASRWGTRASRAVSEAWTQSRGASNEGQAFLQHLGQNLGGHRRSALQLSRMSVPALKVALDSAGASRDEIVGVTRFVQNALAHQFEREVQGHVIERFEGLVQELERARDGHGAEFEARLEQLSGVGGQRLMRVMQGMGIDVGELNALVNEWGGPNVHREAVVQRMRGPLQSALEEMHEVATVQLNDAQGSVFRDETYRDFMGAADVVAHEWGLQRGAIRRPTNPGSSVVGSALQRRHWEATNGFAEDVARSVAGTLSPHGALYKVATLIIDYAHATTAATREATMAEVGEGDPGEAIVGRAAAVAAVATGAGEIAIDIVAGAVMEHVNEQAVEGANRLFDAATESARSPGLARDALEEATERGVGALVNAGQAEWAEFWGHQDRPAVRKDTNHE